MYADNCIAFHTKPYLLGYKVGNPGYCAAMLLIHDQQSRPINVAVQSYNSNFFGSGFLAYTTRIQCRSTLGEGLYSGLRSS